MSPPSSELRAWVGVVSKAHVMRGVEGGFAQLCHGKQEPIDRMRTGDWLIYYSPRSAFPAGTPLRAFTAIGRVVGSKSYEFDMGGGFIPYRRDVQYEQGLAEVALKEIAPRLDFIQRNPNWGMLARRGHFEISLHDLEVILSAMRTEHVSQRRDTASAAASRRSK